MRQTLARDGAAALFRSYRTTVVMNIPFMAVHFSVYEGAKKFLLGLDDDGGDDGGGGGGGEAAEETLSVQLVAGGLAGGD